MPAGPDSSALPVRWIAASFLGGAGLVGLIWSLVSWGGGLASSPVAADGTCSRTNFGSCTNGSCSGFSSCTRLQFLFRLRARRRSSRRLSLLL